MRIGLSLVALLAVMAVAAVAAAQRSGQAANLRDLGEAPELRNNVFLNTDAPLRLADLRGQVVLIKFWTYDCINCIRSMPYVQGWHETYADEGLVVIGNHYPEFAYERDLNNVEAALGRLNINFPVAQDNSRATWAAYNQRFWPTVYLIDKAGQIRYKHIGEGQYPQTEAAIQALLAEDYTPTVVTKEPASERLFVQATEPLNVRTGPGTNHRRVATVSTNAVFVVLGEQDGWYEIEFDGEGGHYLSGEYTDVAAW